MHIHTKDPTFHWEGASRTTYGSLNTFDQALMLSGPLTESLAFRFAGEGSTSESQVDYPYLRSQPGYDDLTHSDSYNLRFKLLYQQPGDDSFSAKLSYNHSFSSPAANDVFGPNAPGSPPGLSFYDRRWLSASAAQQLRSAHSDLGSLELNWKLDNGLRFFSQTSFTRTETNINAVSDAFIRDDVEREFTQEVRAHYQSDKTRAVVGLYGNFAWSESTQIDIERERLNLALFGEVDHEFAPKWHSVIGARLDSDDFQISSSNAPTADSYYLRLLPKAALRYEFTPDHNLSFTVQQGYRSGGAGADVDGTLYSFDPSTTWNYELALRSLWFDGRMQTNLNVFYTSWKDQQVVMRDIDLATFSASERVINAAEAELGGVELETRWQATPELSFFLSGGYLTTTYKDFTYDIDPATAAAFGIPARLDYAGYNFPESPRFNASLGFDYHHKSGFFLTFDAEATSSYYSPYLFASAGSGVGAVTSVQVPQNEVVEIGGRVICNASIGYEREKWSVTLFVRNLFDHDYLIGKTPSLTGGGGSVTYGDGFLATVGQPRFIGVSVNLKF